MTETNKPLKNGIWKVEIKKGDENVLKFQVFICLSCDLNKREIQFLFDGDLLEDDSFDTDMNVATNKSFIYLSSDLKDKATIKNLILNMHVKSFNTKDMKIEPQERKYWISETESHTIKLYDFQATDIGFDNEEDDELSI